MIKNIAIISLTVSFVLAALCIFLTIWHGKLPGNTLDALMFCSYLALLFGLVPLLCLKLAKVYPESKKLLKIFCIILITQLALCYLIVAYFTQYQTAFSIFVSSSVIAMGWWIQNINQTTNARKAHTLNVMMQSRMSAPYLQRLEAVSTFLKGDKYVSEELAKLGDVGRLECGLEFNNIPKRIRFAYESLRYILNYYEFLAQGIRAKDLDEKLIYQCFSGFMQNLEKKGFFVIKTAIERDSLHYEGLIWLLEKWEMSSFKAIAAKAEPEKELGEQVPNKLSEK